MNLFTYETSEKKIRNTTRKSFICRHFTSGVIIIITNKEQSNHETHTTTTIIMNIIVNIVDTITPGPRIVPSCHPGWGAVSDLGAVLLKEALKWDTAIVVPQLELRLPLFN